MFRLPATMLRATAIAIPLLLATAIAGPAAAQFGASNSFDSFDNFHDRLAPYGTWSNNPRWGDVWHPTRVERGFRPYYNGHWEDTREYGWYWVSDESWGDIPYHYGRWVFDPRDGWLWVPGYVWAPSWVVWRSGGGNIGWFPMPPADNYYGDGAYRDNFDNQYGYRDWSGPSFGNEQFLALWTFVGESHFRDRDFRNYAVPQRDYGRFISQTRDSTNYVTINNYVVNRSIDASRLQQATNQQFQPVPASSVIGRTALVTQAAIGRQVEQRERQQRPIPASINPAEQRGRANLNSNAQQQNPQQAPQGFGSRLGNRGAEPNGPGQPTPQTERGAAVGPPTPATPAGPAGPATDTSRQNGRGQASINPAERRGGGNSNAQQQNQAPQGFGGRAGDRGPNTNAPAQSNLQPDRGAAVGPAGPATDTSRQNGRSQASINPAERRGGGNSNAQQQNPNQAPQGFGGRAGERGPNANGPAQSNLQPDRGAPVTSAPPPKENAAPQDLAERRNRGPAAQAGPAAPPTAAAPAAQATPPNPAANTGAQANPRTERSIQSPRGAAEQNGKVIVQDSRTPPRARGNAPAPGPAVEDQANQARGSKQGDATSPEEQKAADDKKKARAQRGQN